MLRCGKYFPAMSCSNLIKMSTLVFSRRWRWHTYKQKTLSWANLFSLFVILLQIYFFIFYCRSSHIDCIKTINQEMHNWGTFVLLKNHLNSFKETFDKQLLGFNMKIYVRDIFKFEFEESPLILWWWCDLVFHENYST